MSRTSVLLDTNHHTLNLGSPESGEGREEVSHPRPQWEWVGRKVKLAGEEPGRRGGGEAGSRPDSL